MTDPLGHVTSYVYNGLGEQIETIAPDPATGLDDAGSPVTTTSYDADGNVLGVTDALGHATSYSYDGIDRNVSETDADGDVTRYSYGPRKRGHP